MRKIKFLNSFKTFVLLLIRHWAFYASHDQTSPTTRPQFEQGLAYDACWGVPLLTFGACILRYMLTREAKTKNQWVFSSAESYLRAFIRSMERSDRKGVVIEAAGRVRVRPQSTECSVGLARDVSGVFEASLMKLHYKLNYLLNF